MSKELARELAPLQHLRITEVSTGLMAGHCGQLFVGLGAHVRHVDASNDLSLRSEPPYSEDSNSESLMLSYLSRGKDTIALRPSADNFQQRLDEILQETDILIEDTWPDLLFSGETSPDALIARHPELVVVSLSPFGRTGPCRNWRGGELCAESAGGFSYVTGQAENPPLKLAGNIYAYTAATHGVSSGISALRTRRAGGTGQIVDISLTECVSAKHETSIIYPSMGLVQSRCAAPIPFYYPHVVFPCADGFFQVGVGYADSQAATATFLADEEFGKDPRFTTHMNCFMNMEAMAERILAGVKDRTRKDLFDAGSSLGLVCGPVSTPEEVLDILQLEERDFWDTHTLRSGQSLRVPGSPLHFRTHASVRQHSDAQKPTTPDATEQSRGAPGRPLEGLRVVDFTQAWAGPISSRILSELGADVIRVGSTTHPWREMGLTYWPENEIGDEPWNRQMYVLEKYLGKREVVLDITQPRGYEILEQLLAVSDIFIENHSPRALAKMNLRYEQLAEKFPHLIMVSISGYGQEGPWGPRNATGDATEALASLSYCTGYRGGPPERPGNTIIDSVSGTTAAAGVLAAIEYRSQHGHGLYLDLSMLETSVAAFSEPVLAASAGSAYPIRDGSRHARRAPHDFYPCRGDDEWIAIDVEGESAWAGLARTLGREEWLRDSRLSDAAGRLAHIDELDEQIAEKTVQWEKSELAKRLQEAGVAAAPALDYRELYLDPHLNERGMIQKMTQPLIGKRPWIRSVPGRIEGVDLSIPRAAPMLGEHNEEVLGGLLGISKKELQELGDQGIIGKRPVSPEENVNLNPELYSQYPGIRFWDPDYRKRLGLDE